MTLVYLALAGAGVFALLYRRNVFIRAPADRDFDPNVEEGSYWSTRTTPYARGGIIHGRGTSYKGNGELLVQKGGFKKEWLEHHDREDTEYDIGLEAVHVEDVVKAAVEYQPSSLEPKCCVNKETYRHPGEADSFQHGSLYGGDQAQELVHRRFWNRAARDPGFR